MLLLTSLTDIDVAQGISRFGNSEPLYRRCLKCFPDDPSFALLGQALTDEDIGRAFLHAHSLKGLCAQLCITSLLPSLISLCDTLRTCDASHLPAACSLYAALAPHYHAVSSRIQDLP